MTFRRITLEHGLYGTALIAALALRLLPLGFYPLNESEAGLALNTLALLNGGGSVTAPEPLYILGSALIGFVFGASEFTARLLPALAGLAIVVWPFMMRDWLGKRTALILAFLFALDPGLTGSSVQAGSGTLAIACALFTLARWWRGKSYFAGVFTGLFLLSGPSMWPGLLSVGIAFGAVYRKSAPLPEADGFDARKAGPAALTAFLLAGSLALAVPSGLSSAASSLTTYLAGWVRAGGTWPGLMMIALVVYEALFVVLGLARIFQGVFQEHSKTDLFLAVWAFSALALSLVYPSREVTQLGWVIVPLLILAARQLDRMLVIGKDDQKAILGQAGLVLLLLLLMINLGVSWPQSNPAEANQLYRWMVLAMAVLLMVGESLLVAWGWGRKIAAAGLLWGITCLLGIYTFSSAVHTAGLAGAERNSLELWRTGTAFRDSDLLLGTLENFSQWTSELRETPRVVLRGVDGAALRWTLRDQPGLVDVEKLSAASQPEFIISNLGEEIEQSASYTGQEFILAQRPAWALFGPMDWLNWALYRKIGTGTVERAGLILWVRADRFPGAPVSVSQP
jgi:hypothetical protein